MRGCEREGVCVCVMRGSLRSQTVNNLHLQRVGGVMSGSYVLREGVREKVFVLREGQM